MANFCLPKKYSAAFQAAIRPDAKGNQGPLHPSALRRMSSEERRAAFAKVIGEENAKEVNIKFEKQILLADQQKAMVNFINDMQGLNSAVKKDMVDQVLGMRRILSPKFARRFLEDLAAKKLGANISHAEAETIFNLAETAEKSKQEYLKDPQNNEKRIDFGVDLIKLNDEVNTLKNNNMTKMDHFFNVVNLPKQLSTTLDFSATLVQMSSMITSSRFWEGFIQQFKYAWNEENFNKLRADIVTHPYYDLAVNAKLGLGEIADRLKPGEELIQSNLIEGANKWLKEKSGGKVPNVIGGANRAFVGYINYVRFKTFTDLIDAAKLRGEDVGMGSTAVRDIAENINTFSGRGNIGIHDKFSNAVPFINMFTWTVRKVSSTLTLMSPVPFMKASPTARAFAMRQMAGTVTATFALYGMARMMGADVNLDPSSSEFGWIGIGKTKFNPLGDKPTYARLLWRLATGRIVSSTGIESHVGDGFPAQTRADLIERFARGKLGPTASVIADALYGKDFMGNEMHWDGETLSREMSDRMVPMGVSSFVDVVQNDPDNTAGQILSMSSIFGVSTFTDVPKVRQGLTHWGDSITADYEDKGVNLDEKLAEIQKSMPFPPKKINGVPLTDKQYHDYLMIQGQAAKQQLRAAVDSGQWGASSEEEKKLGWKNILRISRSQAQAGLMMNSQDNKDGEDNPIFDLSEAHHDEITQRIRQ